VADHTWRLCLMAMVLADRFDGLDAARLLKICIIHDLGEAIHGDIPAVDQQDTVEKGTAERADLLQLLAPLPEPLKKEITALWDDYENAASPEAKVAKALDKLETILQHNQGNNPPDFDYRFNLDYGSACTAAPPLIAAIREILDRETAARAEEGRGALEGGR
jgi:putative hydrolase of HD superfamily